MASSTSSPKFQSPRLSVDRLLRRASRKSHPRHMNMCWQTTQILQYVLGPTYWRVQESFSHKKTRTSHLQTMANVELSQFIVMFRSRFTEAFPKSLFNFGPQELERDVVDTVPGEGVEHLLCALLGLLLNRKQDVKCVYLGEPAWPYNFLRSTY